MEQGSRTITIDDDIMGAVGAIDGDLKKQLEGLAKSGHYDPNGSDLFSEVINAGLTKPGATPESDPEPQAEPDPTKEVKTDPQTQRLQADLEAARRQASEAVKQAQRALAIAAAKDQEVAGYQQRAQLADYDLLTNAKSHAERELGVLKTELIRAHDAYDTAKIADIQIQIAAKTHEIADYAAGEHQFREYAARQEYENTKRQQQLQEQQALQRQQAAKVDPFEQAVQQFTPQSQQWIRAHPECLTDQNKYQSMLTAHHVAIDQGMRPDTPEYFQYIEGKLGYRRTESDPRRQQKSTGGFSAPVSRSASASTTGRPMKVTLSPEQVDIANRMGMSLEEYGAGVVLEKAKQQGAYNG